MLVFAGITYFPVCTGFHSFVFRGGFVRTAVDTYLVSRQCRPIQVIWFLFLLSSFPFLEWQIIRQRIIILEIQFLIFTVDIRNPYFMINRIIDIPTDTPRHLLLMRDV